METNLKIDSVLLNLYNEDHHHVKFHQDNEQIFGPEPNIFSISLGCERQFILGPKECKESTRNQIAISLTSGTLLCMSGATQADWFHMVPLTHNAGPRINATFRTVNHL